MGRGKKKHNLGGRGFFLGEKKKNGGKINTKKYKNKKKYQKNKNSTVLSLFLSLLPLSVSPLHFHHFSSGGKPGLKKDGGGASGRKAMRASYREQG